MKSVFKIYEELNGIKAINETRQSNAIEKIITFPDSGNIAINSTNESFKKIVNEEYEKYEKKQETYLKGLNPVISENVAATSKKNIQSEVLASKGKILVNQISEVAKWVNESIWIDTQISKIYGCYLAIKKYPHIAEQAWVKMETLNGFKDDKEIQILIQNTPQTTIELQAQLDSDIRKEV